MRKLLGQKSTWVGTLALIIFLIIVVIWVRLDNSTPTGSITIAEIERLIEEGNYEQAIDALDREIMDRGYPELYVVRADLYSRLRRFDQAVTDYTEYLDSIDDAEVLVKRCNAFRMKAQFERALMDCESALSINPESSNAFLNLGLIYLDKGELASAEKALENAISYDQANSAAYIARFQLFGSQGNLDQAMDALNSCISVDPENIPCYWERGQLRLANADVTGAISDFQEILDRGNPKFDGEYMFKAGSQLRFIDN